MRVVITMRDSKKSHARHVLNASRLVFPYVLIFPALTFIVCFLLLPIVYSVWMSLNDISRGPSVFVGLRNYVRLFTHPLFYLSLVNTVVWAFFVTFGSIILSLACSFVLDQQFRGNRLARNLIMLPWMVPIAASAVAWSWIYNGDYGVLDHVLARVLKLSVFENWWWLSSPDTALWSVMVADIWRKFPFYTISALAAMQSIPDSLYESADVDGATAFQKYRHITLPGIKSVLLIMLLLNLIWTFQAFAMIYLLTRGGPLHRSEVLGTLMYWMAFASTRMDLASAIGVVILVLLLVVAYMYVRMTRVMSSEEGI